MSETQYSEDLPAVMERVIDRRTLDDVARLARVDASLLSRMRSRGKVPRRETVARIADNLGLRPGLRRDLFRACGYVPTETPAEVGA